jgi:hypothetical protein
MAKHFVAQEAGRSAHFSFIELQQIGDYFTQPLFVSG